MNNLTEDNRIAIKSLAEQAAREAGRLLLELAEKPRQLTIKGFRDVVTDADFASQELIVDMIRQQFPTHGFLPEEKDSSLPETGDVIWIIDPVDGTNNYARRSGSYTISIAAVAGDKLIAGAIYDPVADELFSAGAGIGAFCNDKPIKVSQRSTLGESIVSHDWSREANLREAMLQTVININSSVYTMRAIGTAALALAYVATGRFEAYINYGASAWDIAAGALIIHEAGGTLSHLDGAPWQPLDQTGGCIGTNGLIHDTLQAEVTQL